MTTKEYMATLNGNPTFQGTYMPRNRQVSWYINKVNHRINVDDDGAREKFLEIAGEWWDSMIDLGDAALAQGLITPYEKRSNKRGLKMIDLESYSS